jgi:hypothetical protein
MPGSVFELANALDRPLPQYHPRQLYMLVMSNWFERANAIIIHLGQCLQVGYWRGNGRRGPAWLDDPCRMRLDWC